MGRVAGDDQRLCAGGEAALLTQNVLEEELRALMEETMNNVEIHNNPSQNRYEIWADGKLAGYTQYVLRDGRIAFVHTKVYDSYEGLGLGSQLARAALDDARARGLLVMPYCPFIAGFIERHLDEYRDHVAPEMLGG
jgi:predicted GNAT family acetyltransferase